jgi:hypothetical protein
MGGGRCLTKKQLPLSIALHHSELTTAYVNTHPLIAT